ncbi:MAG: SMI1/KNR4 family protein [Bacteroidales bacterium]|nr:SMI1/KNR4 family protein [Bacteroidales bacterium]
MKELIDRLFTLSIKLGDFEFTCGERQTRWLGRPPASSQEIIAAEQRLNQCLPTDYKSLLAVTNGYRELTNVEPSFLPIERVDWLKNVNPEQLRITKEFGDDPEEEERLERSIVIGGIDEEQSFYIIPPDPNKNEWTYYKYAYWDPMGSFYSGIEEYLKDTINFMEKEIALTEGGSDGK